MVLLLSRRLIWPQGFSRGFLFQQHQTNTFVYAPPSLSQNQTHLANSGSRHASLVLLIFWYVGFVPTPPWPLSTSFKTVTPAHSASFLFKIESDVGRGAEYINLCPPISFTPAVVGETLKLHIVYREFRKGRCLVVGIGV